MGGAGLNLQWWNSLSKESQIKYKQENPNSKYEITK